MTGARRLVPLLAALAAACAAPPPEAPQARNVVVVLVDTLRADHLALYGYGRTTTPELDRWARAEGVVFESARAQAPCTFPSVNSLLTSRSPALFYARGKGGELGIPDSTPSLAARLDRAGFTTAAVSASPIVRATPSEENPSAGFGAGFDRFDEFCLWREAGCVTARARQLVRELDEPFLLYLHYMDPHDPYRLPDGVAARFAGAGPPEPEREFVRLGDPRPVAEHLYAGGPDPGLTAADVAHWIDLYDDEIRYWDREFAPLAAELARRFPETAFVVLSDHGEEFLEHGHVKHCRTLYDTELRVPIVLFAPGLAAGRVGAPAMNLDLVPTLLDLLGLPAVPGELEGTSLLELAGEPRAARGATRLQLATNGRLWAAVDGSYKLIQESAKRREELYDLGADPGELTELGAREPEPWGRLRRELAAWRRGEGRAAVEGALEAERKLRSVGYLQ